MRTGNNVSNVQVYTILDVVSTVRPELNEYENHSVKKTLLQLTGSIRKVARSALLCYSREHIHWLVSDMIFRST